MNSIPLLKQFGTTSQYEYPQLRGLLVTHFSQKRPMQQIVWPRSLDSNHRANIDYLIRAGAATENALYHRPSHLRLKVGKQSIGDGLFSHIMYKGNKSTPSSLGYPGEKICQFHGVIKTEEQYNEDAAKGKGGYTIRLSAGNV